MKKAFLLLGFGIILLLAISNSAAIAADNPGQDLRTAIQKKENKVAKKAIEKLVQQNDEKAFTDLKGSLDLLGDQPEQDLYMAILSGIARLTNKEVIQKITDLILAPNRNKDLGTDLLGVMKSNRDRSVIPLLGAVLEKGNYAMQSECLHQLSSINAKESLETIFNFLRPITSDDKGKKEIVKEAIGALKKLTGLDRGNYIESWLPWWDENKTKSSEELIKPKEIEGDLEHVGQYRDMTGVKTLDPDKIIVVRNDACDENIKKGGRAFDGNFDHIQAVLARLGIGHTVIGKTDLEKDSFDWNSKWAIIFNCNFFKDHCCNPDHMKLKPTGKKGATERTQVCPGESNHMNHNTRLNDKTIQKLKTFVDTGGYLFTEDLNIEEIIERAFKGIITHTKYLPGKVVKIMPAKGAALHPYLKFVFEAPPTAGENEVSEEDTGKTKSFNPGDFRVDAEWQVDDESPDIKILNKEKVTILITSPDLAKTNKNEGAVAVTWGSSDSSMKITGGTGGSRTPEYNQVGGRVLHVMSHFGKQRSKLDEFALQNLILNFLMELNDRRPRTSNAGKK